ncbi:MAG: MFS transporter [Thermodesulfobacteriota bacterium]|nr:MFS transporter [Thermodesulfobacteriota bacterium]
MAQITKQKFFFGYVVVLGAWLAMFVSAGAQFSFGIFQPYLLKEFGWSRGMLSLGFTLNLVTMPVFGLLGGYLVDRIGPRWTVIIGGIIGGIGMVLLSTITQTWHFILLYGIIFPMGIGLSYMIATVPTVRRWFMRKAALMVAIAMTGSGLGIVVLTPIAQYIISSSNWQMGYISFGVILALGATIGGLLLKKDPESMGTYPDGKPPTQEELKKRPDFRVRNEKWSVKEAFKTSALRLIIIVQAGHLMAVFGFLGHLITWANLDLGISIDNAVSVFSFGFVLSAVIGRLFSGAISDWYMKRFNWSRKLILYFNVIGVAIGCFMATYVTGLSTLIVVGIIIGFTYGTGLSTYPVYLGDLFGVTNLPVLFGAIGLFASTAGAIGPVLYGFSYDIIGSYNPAFVINGLYCLLSTIALWFIQTPKKRSVPI